MAGYLRRTWFGAAERQQRGLLRVLGERQLKLFDRANAECDAVLRTARARRRADLFLRAARARSRAIMLIRKTNNQP